MQAISGAIPEPEQKLPWIEGTTRRFDGDTYFGRHPDVADDWCANPTR